MNKLLFLVTVFLVIISITSCTESNNGYGYNNKSFKKESHAIISNRVAWRNFNGRICRRTYIFRGEFDGHTWYL